MPEPLVQPEASGAMRAARVLVILAGALVAGLIIFLSVRRTWAVDYWWLVKTGEYVALHGVPYADVFSYTNFGTPRIEVRWGFAWLLYLLTDWLGHSAAVVVKTVIVCATFGIAGAIGPWRKAPLLTAAVVAIAAIASYQRFYIRPEVISYVCFILTVLIVDSARSGRTWVVWILPIVQLLWVNMHGVFVLGPAIVGAWLASEILELVFTQWRGGQVDPARRKRLMVAIATLAALILVSLINPNGYKTLLLPLTHFAALHGTAQKGFLIELTSPFAFTQDWIAIFYYKVLIILAAGSLVLNWRKQQVFWLILIVSQFYLSASAIRNVPFFCLIAIPFIVRNLSEAEYLHRLLSRKVWIQLRCGLAVTLVIFCAYQIRELYTNRFAIKQGDTNQFGIGVATHWHPIEAAEFIARSGADVRERGLLNTLQFGSYFIYAGFKVFVDPRAEEHMHGVFDEYRSIIERRKSLADAAREHDFKVAVLEVEMLDLIRDIRAMNNWRMVHADEVAVVFFRNDMAGDIPALDPTTDRKWFELRRERLAPPVDYEKRGVLTQLDNPLPYRRLANFCYTVRAFEEAKTLYLDQLKAYPPRFADEKGLAAAAFQTGDPQMCLQWVDLAIERLSAHEHEARSGGDEAAFSVAQAERRMLRLQAAASHLQTGSSDRARPYLESVLQTHPLDSEANAMLGILRLKARQFEEAERLLRIAVAADPNQPVYRVNLAQALLMLGQTEDGLAELHLAAARAPSDFHVVRELAAALISLDRIEEAEQWVQQLERMQPNDPIVVEMRRRMSLLRQAPQ